MMQTEILTGHIKESKQCFAVPAYILDDLCSRFIINIPEEERQDLIRIFFQIELAHWFYLDFYCAENPDLKSCGIKDFSAQIFRHCPTLSFHANNVDKILESWREYKMAVPTYGAILMDPTLQYCLLVQGFWSKASWGFPKGKVNEDEISRDCAVREVLEETGFDIETLIDPEEYIEYKMNEQLSRLYLVPGVSMDTKFQPRTRKEIKSLEWFKIEYLPYHKKDMTCRQHYGLNPNAFFMVIPFVKPLRRWINRKCGGPEIAEHEYKQRPRRESQSDRHGGRVRKESQTDSRQVTMVTAGKQRQKQNFAQDMQNQFQEYMSFAEPAGRSGVLGGGGGIGGKQRARSDSPQLNNSNQVQGSRGMNGNRQQNQSPRAGSSTNQKKPRKKDGFQGNQTHPKRSLATQFTDGSNIQSSTPPKKHPKARRERLWSHTWANFKLDGDAILGAMFPSSSTQQSQKKP